MALVDYLFDLFAASPFELFSRLSVLSVLDQVKKDKSLFPDRIKTVDPPTPARGIDARPCLRQMPARAGS
jgi:hypothetical protein